ncbi:MAG: glycosyltransferase [Candidatus Brocadiaceae bacterium]|nr:glycosyltransferase [Candidatus Brocadiaceae bacterium]
MNKVRTPRVSVLMPVYNGESFLREAIESILAQTFIDFEFLIINDASTDRSIEIIESYHDHRICLLHNENNLGIGASLNKGIKYARGEYFARMDCDDISMPNRLFKQVAFMDNHPEVGVCGTWTKAFSNGDEWINKYPIDSESIKCRMFYNPGVAHPSVMLRKDMFVVNELYYGESWIHVEDFDLWVRAKNHMQFANIPEILLHYRGSQRQVSRIDNEGQRGDAAKIRERLLIELGIYPSDEEKDIHESIIAYNFKETKDYLEKVNAWLLKIKDANLNKKKYAEPIFSNQLSNSWFIACYWTARLGNNTWNILRKSPLYNRNQITSIDKIKHFLKCKVKFW